MPASRRPPDPEPGAASAAAEGGLRGRRVALAVVLVAAAVLRLAHWQAVRDQPFFARLAMDAQEYDRWARAIAAGDWLGSEPFFQAPLYPYLMAVVYRLTGPSYDAIYLLQIGLALVGLALVARAADRMLGPPHGVVAAALGALYLPFVFHEVQIAKEGVAVVAAAALLERLAAARSESGASGGLGACAAAGALLGLLALLRENALLLAPLLAPLLWRRSEPRVGVRRLAAYVAGFALVLAPVAVRNAALGGGLLPTTFQGGVNFWIGNHPGADGTYRPISVGKQVPRLERAEPRRLAEAAAGRELSGAEVSRHWLRRSLAWAAAEPAAFARLQLAKLGLYLSWYEWPDAVDYYWTKGISPPLAAPLLEFGALSLLAAVGLLIARRRARELAPVVLFELGWLVSTVAFFVFSRYRLPAVPGLLVLAAVPLVAALEAWRGRSGRRATALATLASITALAWVAPHATGYRPRADLVEYNLGRLAQEAGDLAAAEAHYRAALAVDDRNLLATMNLGTLAARRGDLAVALPLLERAAALEPGSDDARANLGAARLAAGDRAGARAELERALALNPSHAAARGNLQRLERLEQVERVDRARATGGAAPGSGVG